LLFHFVIFVVVFSFFAAAVFFFLLQGKSAKKVLLEPGFFLQQAGALEDFFTIMKCFCTTCEALYTTAREAPQAKI